MSLRRFGLIDEVQLTHLFNRAKLPSLKTITKLLKNGSRDLPAGIPGEYVAKSILQSVVACDKSLFMLGESPIASPLVVVNRATDFSSVITQMIGVFKHFVEQQGGRKLVSDDEDRAQLTMLACMQEIAKRNNIDLSREVETGRGPIDFKASQGFSFRSLIELKRASNSGFWNGLEAQLPTYLHAQQIDEGHFVAIVQSGDTDNTVTTIQSRVEALRRRVPFAIHTHVVDARPRPSASKLKDFEAS